MKRKIAQIPKVTERSALAKSIGMRMKEAREIAGISQSEAARRLGYSNSSKLAKVEGGTDTNSVPLWLIVRAARIYEVSIDFLFGESKDWELSSKACMDRDVSKWVFETWEVLRQRDMEVLMRLRNRLGAIGDSTQEMMAASQEVEAAMLKFIELNALDFDDMRGGNRLKVAIDRLFDITTSSTARISKFRKECSLSGVAKVISDKESRQLKLF